MFTCGWSTTQNCRLRARSLCSGGPTAAAIIFERTETLKEIPAPRLRELHSIGLLDISASNHRLCPLADVPQVTEAAASAGSLKDVVIQSRSSTFQENKSMLSKQAPIDSGFGPQRIAIETLGGAGLRGKVAIVAGGA